MWTIEGAVVCGCLLLMLGLGDWSLAMASPLSAAYVAAVSGTIPEVEDLVVSSLMSDAISAVICSSVVLENFDPSVNVN